MTDQPLSARTRRNPNGVNWLLVALCPLVFWLLRGDMARLVSGIVLLAIFGIAAHLLISALEDEEMGEMRPHRYPRKIIGSALIGLGVTLMALIQTTLGPLSLAVGFMAFALGCVAFGVEQGVSLKMKLGRKASKQTHQLIDTTERILAAIPLRVSEVDDEPVYLQAKAFRDTVMQLLEENADLVETIAPELRHVLTEAAEATDQFVEDYLEMPEARVKRRYMVLLRDLAEALNLCIKDIRAQTAGDMQDCDALADEMAGKRAA